VNRLVSVPPGCVPGVVLVLAVLVGLVRPLGVAPGRGTTGTIGRGRRCASCVVWRSVRMSVSSVPGGVSVTTSPVTRRAGCVEWWGEPTCFA